MGLSISTYLAYGFPTDREDISIQDEHYTLWNALAEEGLTILIHGGDNKWTAFIGVERSMITIEHWDVSKTPLQVPTDEEACGPDELENLEERMKEFGIDAKIGWYVVRDIS